MTTYCFDHLETQDLKELLAAEMDYDFETFIFAVHQFRAEHSYRTWQEVVQEAPRLARLQLLQAISDAIQ